MDQRLLTQLQSSDPGERREAIRALARSGDSRALPILKHVYQNDSNLALRELARKAGQHLWQQINDQKQSTSPQPPAPIKSTPLRTDESIDDHTPISQEQSSEPVSEQRVNTARAHLARALSLYQAADTVGALKVFWQAIDLHPELVNDRVTANVAGKLTGLPPVEAMQKMTNKSRRKNIIATAQAVSRGSRQRGSRQRGRPITLILLIVALILLAVVVGYFVRAGYLGRYLVAIQMYGGGNKQTVDGTEYYLIRPWGFAPANGWPVVVALHGYGGDREQMLPLATAFTREGAIFVSPTFGGYEPMPGSGPIEPMKRILEEVSLAYPVDQRGVVLFGFSQGGTFAYRFSVYHPELVAGVVTAGAPDLDAGEPARSDLPYVFTWGQNDGLQDFVLPTTVYPLIRRGYNVEYAVIKGAGHEVTPYAIERALQMINAQE